jgi:hypothetical protein
VGNKKLAIIHLGDWRQNKYPQQDISFSECSTIMENFQHTFTLCVCVCVCVCVCALTHAFLQMLLILRWGYVPMKTL